jgi:hypothetical protein
MPFLGILPCGLVVLALGRRIVRALLCTGRLSFLSCF